MSGKTVGVVLASVVERTTEADKSTPSRILIEVLYTPTAKTISTRTLKTDRNAFILLFNHEETYCANFNIPKSLAPVEKLLSF